MLRKSPSKSFFFKLAEFIEKWPLPTKCVETGLTFCIVDGLTQYSEQLLTSQKIDWTGDTSRQGRFTLIGSFLIVSCI